MNSEEENLQQIAESQKRTMGMLQKMKSMLDSMSKPTDLTRRYSNVENGVCPVCNTETISLNCFTGNYECSNCKGEF